MTAPHTGPAAVQITDLVVVRGGKTVLRSVSCAVKAGTVTGLLGPSGCGKTTLMRSIVGVQIVQSGMITVLGKPAGAAQLRQEVGYVTQAPSIYADLTVVDNCRYFADIYGLSPRSADRAIADVGLSDHRDHLVGALSGGQRTRASLACALIATPRLLILDEPTVGLDPVLRRDLWQQFHQLAADGTTLIVSSHVMDEAGRCDDLLLMRDGQLIEHGTPSQIRHSTGSVDLEQAFLRVIEAQPHHQMEVQ